MVDAICVICGKNFAQKGNRKTCSKECSAENARMAHLKAVKKYNERNKEKISNHLMEKHRNTPRRNTPGASREYRENNKEKIKQINKKYYSKNKEKINHKHKEYYINNKDKIIQNGKEYYSKNKEKIVAQRKEKREVDKMATNIKENYEEQDIK